MAKILDSIFIRTFIVSLFIFALWVNFFHSPNSNFFECIASNSFLCLVSQQHFKFGSAWRLGQLSISSSWILLNIVAGIKQNSSSFSFYDSIETTTSKFFIPCETVLSYFGNWNVEHNWLRTRTFFHIINFLLSESCVWLSLYYFFSTDPFATKHCPSPQYVVFINILWFVFVLAYACMNSLTHLIMIYHHHYQARPFHISPKLKPSQ